MINDPLSHANPLLPNHVNTPRSSNPYTILSLALFASSVFVVNSSAFAVSVGHIIYKGLHQNIGKFTAALLGWTATTWFLVSAAVVNTFFNAGETADFVHNSLKFWLSALFTPRFYLRIICGLAMVLPSYLEAMNVPPSDNIDKSTWRFISAIAMLAPFIMLCWVYGKGGVRSIDNALAQIIRTPSAEETALVQRLHRVQTLIKLLRHPEFEAKERIDELLQADQNTIGFLLDSSTSYVVAKNLIDTISDDWLEETNTLMLNLNNTYQQTSQCLYPCLSSFTSQALFITYCIFITVASIAQLVVYTLDGCLDTMDSTNLPTGLFTGALIGVVTLYFSIVGAYLAAEQYHDSFMTSRTMQPEGLPSVLPSYLLITFYLFILTSGGGAGSIVDELNQRDDIGWAGDLLDTFYLPIIINCVFGTGIFNLSEALIALQELVHGKNLENINEDTTSSQILFIRLTQQLISINDEIPQKTKEGNDAAIQKFLSKCCPLFFKVPEDREGPSDDKYPAFGNEADRDHTSGL